MKKCMIPLFMLLLGSGCTTITIENTTKDGRTFKATAYSFLWDRNLKNLKFDYEKGTLDVINLNSTPDKVTLGKGIDAVAAGLQVMKAAL